LQYINRAISTKLQIASLVPWQCYPSSALSSKLNPL
jgi:hypothetical protein